MDLVVAIDRNWGIGKANGLPWPRLRGDFAHFRRLTTGDGRNAIVMGRLTWDSLGQKPLPNRLNVVVTRGGLDLPDGVALAGGFDEALDAARHAERIFVIGGGQLFALALADPRLVSVYLTRVDGDYGCDVRIPDLDACGFVRDETWTGELMGEESGVTYRIERLIARPHPRC